MIPLSILDLSSIGEGSNASRALANTLDLGRDRACGGGHDVPVWILGSSLSGAQLAAALGVNVVAADGDQEVTAHVQRTPAQTPAPTTDTREPPRHNRPTTSTGTVLLNEKRGHFY